MRVLFFIICITLFSACSEDKIHAAFSPSKCMTDEGIAAWDGQCKLGKANGEGTATYGENSFIQSISGNMIDGIPEGIVKINYSSGDYYLGSVQDGEHHGQGVMMRTWGEGWEGNWVKGFRYGEGVYIHSDGTRIPGKWREDKLVRSIYTDPETGCNFWWAADDDPVGTANWSGTCENGKAVGAGTITWSVSENGAPISSKVTFTGELIDGVIHGKGVWVVTDVFKNVISNKTVKATWQDGELTGFGEEVRTSDFIDKRSFDTIVRTYKGLYKKGDFSGKGRLEETETQSNGDMETLIREGLFDGNMLNGAGKEKRDITYVNGDFSSEVSEGLFTNNQFTGYGERHFKRLDAVGEYILMSTFEANSNDGGQGTIRYPNGDSFAGHVDLFGSPQDGYCDFSSINFSGKCTRHLTETTKDTGITCLVPKGLKSKCLRQISVSIVD